MSSPRLDQINLVVSNMAASVTFYRLLGLNIPDTEPAWQDHHRTAEITNGLDVDFDSDEFARHWNHGWAGRRVVISFKVDSRERVDELYRELSEAGYSSEQEPYDAFWGARYAVVGDPDGNPVGIMSPVDPDRRSDPGFPVTLAT